MIRITVELVSAIHPSRSKILGVAEIANDGTGDSSVGNYTVRLSKRGRAISQTWREGRVLNFPRGRLGAWDLLYQALRACVGRRNQPLLRVDTKTGEIMEVRE